MEMTTLFISIELPIALISAYIASYLPCYDLVGILLYQKYNCHVANGTKYFSVVISNVNSFIDIYLLM